MFMTSRFFILPRSYWVLMMGLVCATSMVACHKKDRHEHEADSESMAVQTVFNCDDVSIKNALLRTLSTHLNTQMTDLLASYPDVERLNLAGRTQARLDELSIDLQNTRGEGESCVVDVVVPLSQQDVVYADQYFARENLSLVQERADGYGVQFGADNHLIVPVRYQPNQPATSQPATNLVNLIGDNAALTLITQTMSAATYQLIQNEKNTARSTIRISAADPIEVIYSERPPSQDPLAIAYEQQMNKPSDEQMQIQAPNQTTNQTNSELPKETLIKETPIKTPQTKKDLPQGNNEMTVIESHETYD